MFRLRTSHWTWSAIIVVVLVFLVAIQMLRVNQRRFSDPVAEPAVFYTPKGSLLNGPLAMPAGEFYSKRLDLNQRAKLSGSFRTSTLRNRVNTLVIDEKHFEGWKLGEEVPTLARTGYVPGGKISLVLQPGTYLLLIDNRDNDVPQNVSADFLLE